MKVTEFFRMSAKFVARGATISAFCVCASLAAAAPAPTVEQLQHAWGASMARTPVPGEGCFTADYPSRSWTAVACTTAPNHRYGPAHGASGYTVGDGNDYAVSTSGLFTASVGSFPVVKGVTLEQDGTIANNYSLQLNSQFFSGSPACAKAAVPANCLAWQQFVFAEQGSGIAFMQYWLINYVSKCPGGWMTFGSDCYRNSNAVAVSPQPVAQLKHLFVSAEVGGGHDTMVLMTKTRGYSTTGKDSVLELGQFWNASEFNIFGDGDGTAATFNAGPTIEVDIQEEDGTTNAPVCKGNSGTTAETNNLTLSKKCKTFGVVDGAAPHATFTETN